MRKLDEIDYHDHLVLVDAVQNKLVLLNPVAKLVWESLQAGMTEEKMSDVLVARYGISGEMARADIASIVGEWQLAGLLEDSMPTNQSIPTGGGVPVDNSFSLKSTARLLQPIEKYYQIGEYDLLIRYYLEDFYDFFHTQLLHFEIAPLETAYQYEVDLDGADFVARFNGKILVSDSSAATITSDLYESILAYVYPGFDWLGLMHAAATGVNGKAVVFPAVSGSGKSTLSAGLMYAGFEYLGDDVVPVRRNDKKITPIVTTLSIKDGSWELIGKFYPTLRNGREYERLGRRMRYLDVLKPEMGEKVCREISHIIFPRYDSSEPELLREITPADALSRLIGDNVWLGYPLQTQSVQEFLTWLDTKPLYSMTYQSLEQAIEWVREVTHD